MALSDALNLLRNAVNSPPSILRPRVVESGSWDEWWQNINSDLSGATPASLFREQPHLRTVITFRARNTAQLGVHAFERVNETDRRRARESVTSRALANVDGTMTTYELVFSLVGDLDLYDRAHWLVVPSEDLPSGWMIRRLPPAWVTPEVQTAFEVKSWRVAYGRDSVVIDAKNVLSFTGYSPTDPRQGSSTVEALRATLQEQIEATKYRQQIWKRGGRVSAVIERPAEAPRWSPEARDSFREDWYAKFTGKGPRAGGTPILEDGMQMKRIDFNAQEQQFVEATKLSLVTVASSYHVNPTMIGQNDGANYSNVREFRKMLYGDTLGPLLAQIEARINTFLIPMLGEDSSKVYVEFNIEEKMQGSFEEQSEAFQNAAGGPWMTRNEVRARRNLPAIEGGDELIIPLNVLVGGQASVRDGGDGKGMHVPVGGEKAEDGRSTKSRPPKIYDEQSRRVLSAFFRRQGQVVRSHVGAGRDWWDRDRWDKELKDDLSGLYLLTATASGRDTLAQLGINASDYDEPRTMAFLIEAARLASEEMNSTTKAAIERSIATAEEEDRSPVEAVSSVFTIAEDARASQAAAAVVAFAAGFGTVEAARQQVSGATKTWTTTSKNPRPEHAAISGETVPLDDDFSNGLPYPGALGPADEVAGCQCQVTINTPSP